jgi:hypothetical protein
MLPMSIPERRQTTRTTMERLAYINIEPNNGGIVLNVSDEGLCFHSIAPVERNGKLRFSLLEQNRRIEADGELIWMDHGEKVGGLRFSTLSSEARDQIEDWIAEPSTPILTSDHRAPSLPWPQALNAVASSLPGAAAAPAAALAAPQYKLRGIFSGFSGGLAVGLLITGLVTAGFLVHNHRTQLGESLIRIGERLASKSQVQVPTAAQSQGAGQTQTRQQSGAAVSVPGVAHSSLPAPVSTAPSAGVSEQKPVTQLPSKGQLADVTATAHAALEARITVAKGSKSVAAPVPMSAPAFPVPSTTANGVTRLLSEQRVPLPRLEMPSGSNVQAVDSGTDTSGAASRMYFEVGKFKEQLWARKATEKLGQLGFPASIAQKNRLWKNSYYVLVGPYADRKEAEIVHHDLASRGFKPRPFERGSRNFTFSSPVRLNGTEMPLGEFVIRWESYIPDAKVKFLLNDDLVMSVDGRWVDRGVKNERNAFVYEKRGDGSHNLLEIRFAGMSRVLVFSKPS